MTESVYAVYSLLIIAHTLYTSALPSGVRLLDESTFAGDDQKDNAMYMDLNKNDTMDTDAALTNRAQKIYCVQKYLNSRTHQASELLPFKNFLRAYGYLKTSSSDAIDMKHALKAFQKFVNLPVTGKLDAATQWKMRQPRCGNADLGDTDEQQFFTNGTNLTQPHTRLRRYTIEGSYWGVKDITYKIAQYTAEMARADVDKVITNAFNVWEKYSPLRFVKVDGSSTTDVNIEVKFAKGDHGDGEPFDGRGQILAHAFFPRYGGDVHFDDDEPWRALQGKGIDLYSVAAHEIGHSLGLKHSKDHSALMAPFYQVYNDVIELKEDDKRGLQHLYGLPVTDNSIEPAQHMFINDQSSNHIDASPPSSTSHSKLSIDICQDPRLDAITVIGNGTTYAFKGDYYWKLNQLSYDVEYPRRIADDWDGLPNNIDAAVTDFDGDTYFFKGDDYWLFDPVAQRYKGYPRKISVGLVDTPSNLDAALIWNYDEKPYFFKGKEFWQYSRWGVARPDWPKSIDTIFDTGAAAHTYALPSNIDAALKWTNNKTYIFTGDKYYRLSGWRVMKVVPGYPRDIAEWWFGCTPKPAQTRRRRRTADIDYTQK